MSKERSFYIPVTLPIWGVQEPEHLHLNMHLASVFHVEQGRIIGASIYPARDRFQFTRTLSTLNLHGPVKWSAYSCIPRAQGRCVGLFGAPPLLTPHT